MDLLNVRNILVPIDFYESSFNALGTAMAIAKRQGAKITLLHVLNENLLSSIRSNMIPAFSEGDIKQKGSKDIIGQIAENLIHKHGIEVCGEISQGFVSSEICKSAEKNNVDLIVMGAHGASGLREIFIGTNAYAVVKHAHCPVLTVPPQRKWETFSKILFPVRSSDDALARYEYLRKIIHHNHSMLIVLGLPDINKPSTTNWVDDKICQLKNTLQDDHVEFVTEMMEPSVFPAARVLDVAEHIQADLIAISANAEDEIHDFFIGPYAQQIVNHIKMPVISIRADKKLIVDKKTEYASQNVFGSVLQNLNHERPGLAW